MQLLFYGCGVLTGGRGKRLKVGVRRKAERCRFFREGGGRFLKGRGVFSRLTRECFQFCGDGGDLLVRGLSCLLQCFVLFLFGRELRTGPSDVGVGTVLDVGVVQRDA